MPQISLRERHEAVGMLRSMTAPAVARHFSVSRSASSRLQDKLVTTGSAEDRRMRTTHLRYRFMSASSTAREWDDDGDVSRHNVGCHLRQDGIKCRRPCKKKFIFNINRVERLRFATGKVRWTQQDLSRVIYSNESPFTIERHDGRLRCYRRVGESLAPNCVSTV